MKKIGIVTLLIIFSIGICFAQSKTYSKNGIGFEYNKGSKISDFAGMPTIAYNGNYLIIQITGDGDFDDELFEIFLKSTKKVVEEKGYLFLSETTDKTINGINTKSFDVKYSPKEYERKFIGIKNGYLITLTIKCKSEKTINSDFATVLNSIRFEL